MHSHISDTCLADVILDEFIHFNDAMERFRKQQIIRFGEKGMSDFNDTRLSILCHLIENGWTPFLDIPKEMGIDVEECREHLEKLMRHGLVYTRYVEDDFDDKYLQYKYSKIGKAFYEYWFERGGKSG